jgi:hypothetical protein
LSKLTTYHNNARFNSARNESLNSETSFSVKRYQFAMSVFCEKGALLCSSHGFVNNYSDDGHNRVNDIEWIVDDDVPTSAGSPSPIDRLCTSYFPDEVSTMCDERGSPRKPCNAITG